MKQSKIADGRISLIRTGAAALVKQETYHFSDGGSVYYQVFNDGIVFTGCFDAMGKWAFVLPKQVNAFFDLAEKNLELDDRAVIADGHEAAVLKSAWCQLCGSVVGKDLAESAG